MARLPGMLADGPEAHRATGTDNSTAENEAAKGQHLGQQFRGESVQNMGGGGEGDSQRTEQEGSHKRLSANTLGESRRTVASDHESTPGRTRTCNLRIKSPPGTLTSATVS